jgi:hypothetical protein
MHDVRVGDQLGRAGVVDDLMDVDVDAAVLLARECLRLEIASN